MKVVFMKIRYYLLLVAAAFIVAGSFFLPNAVAAITDSRMLDNYVMVDSQSISFEAAPDLDLLDRLSLVASPNTETLPLKTGQVMEAFQACDIAVLELMSLLRGGPIEFDFNGYSVDECSAAFIIDADDPSVNMIIWELELTDRDGNALTVTLDDESGTILKLIHRWGVALVGVPDVSNKTNGFGNTDEEFYKTADLMSKAMSEYYGLPVTLADYQYSGSLAYYRADMFRGRQVISMFGVVRPSGLTMNEKLLY